MNDLVWFSTGQSLPISYVVLVLVLLRVFQVFLLSVNFSRKKLALSILLHLTKLPCFQIFSLHTDSRNLCRQQESLGIKQ